MTVIIKDAEADRVIRLLAARTGETITEAVRKAASERLARLPPRKGRIDWAKLREAQDYFERLPRPEQPRSDDEALGYNDEGHFG